MHIQGLHLLLTNKCNAHCRHCFLNAAPNRGEVFTEELAQKVIDEASEVATIDHFFIEGGEPFLYPKLMSFVIDAATKRGFWVGALTNGFWAFSQQKAREILRPLITAGLKSLSISTDAWHEEFVPLERVKMAVDASQALGLDVDVMVCRSGSADSGLEGEVQRIEASLAPAPVYSGRIAARGRGSSIANLDETQDWKQLTECRESLKDPSRVHVGPGGEIHLCQGLLIGENMKDKKINKIFDGYRPKRNPVISSLIEGGPAALARFAWRHGWRPRPGYADGCQLCFEVRSQLLERFPLFLGPTAVYGD